MPVETVSGTSTSDALAVSAEDVRACVSAALELDGADLPDDVDLFEFGLDSLRLIHLVSHWRGQGIEVSFQELAEVPTVSDWTRILRRASRSDRPSLPEPAPRQLEPVPLSVMQHAYWIGQIGRAHV